jgi:hypothetical protein
MTEENGAASSEEELIKAFQSGSIELSEMPQALQQKLLYGDDPKSEPKEEEPVVTDEIADDAEDAKKEETPAKPKHHKRTKEETSQLLLERANKINELVQGQKKHEHKMATDPSYRADYLKKFNVELPEPAAPAKLDVWSDEHHLSTAKRLEAAEAKLAEITNREAAQAVYQGMEKFAKKSVGYEFQAGLAEIDTATKALEVKLGREPTNAELEGLGFDTEDVEVFDRLVKVQKFQQAKGLEDLDTAWYVYERLHGTVGLPKKSTEDSAEAETETPDDDGVARKARMAEVLQHPKMLSNQRAKTADQGMTAEYAMRWLTSHPDPTLYSEQEYQTYARIKRMQGIS